MKRKILFLVNVDWFFLSHRLPIALEAKRQGYDVHIATTITDKLAELESYGFTVHPMHIARGRAGVSKDLAAFFEIIRLFKSVRPDLVHLVTIKPVLYGGIASRVTKVPAVVAAISGLGFAYSAASMHAKLSRFVASNLYRLALIRPNTVVIVQNPDDLDCLRQMVPLPLENFRIFRGSGADLSKFSVTELPQGMPVVAMACRLLASKGVWEFVEAARILRGRGIEVRFQLAGAIDPDNPDSLTDADIEAIKKEGVVELLGQRNDMENIFANAHIVALPSYYGEGLPKVLIEAAACGRAVVTTDMPGCRDAIIPNVTGLLIPPRDANALADAIARLLQDRATCAAFGKAGRKLAEKEFSDRQIAQAHLQIYRELL